VIRSAPMRPALLALSSASLLLVACGSDDAATVDAAPETDAALIDAAIDAGIDAPIDAPAGPFALTSTAFAEGALIPAKHTCNGVNVSPALAWTNAPAGTLSYAVVLTDTSFMPGFVHSVIYDIPAARAGLPEDVDKTYEPADVPGAHQTRSFNAQITGYNGPCPPVIHTYRFSLYALDVETLPGTTAATTRADAVALILAHDLATANLTGRYMQP
jgi:Raf kinase inhibitor-like YbhB/YbcL family protein